MSNMQTVGSSMNGEISRRHAMALLSALLGGSMGAMSGVVHASGAWRPERSVDFVVGAGASGALDQVGRAAKQFYDQSGTASANAPMLVSNKPGGNGKIAFEVLRQKPGDPHFLAINTHGYIASYLTGSLDILPHRDLTPIVVLQEESHVLAVRADSPYKDLQSVVQALRKDPTSLRIAVATSIGNHIHIGVAKGLKAAGVDVSKLVVAPFRSSGDSMVALIGGQLELVAATTPNAIASLNAGRIRLLAVNSKERLGGIFASVPTWREAGVDTSFNSSLGLVGSKGITAEQIAFWEEMCKQMVVSPDWLRLQETNQSRSMFIPHSQTAAYYEREYLSMRETVRDIGLLKKG